jgi:predicted amidohydrolase
VRVALCQTNCGEDVAANEAQVFGLLEEAGKAAVDLSLIHNS